MSPDGTVRVEYDRTMTNESVVADTFDEWAQSESDPTKDHTRHDHDGEDQHADHEHTGHDHAHGGIFGPKTELIFAFLCGEFLLVGWLLETFAEIAEAIPVGLLITAYFFGGFFTIKEAVEKIRAGKFEIDFLMIVAALGAAALGAAAEGALLLFLFSSGHALEGYAMGRAKRAVEAMSELAPRTARVRRDGKETEVAFVVLLLWFFSDFSGICPAWGIF